MTTPGPRVPGYLGRVLDGDGTAVGTCFQVERGVLVTAAHVLADIGADAVDAVVAIGPFGAGAARQAQVVRVEHVTDLAVLTTAEPLDACVAGLVATDGVAWNTDVVVTGVAQVDDPGHTYGHLDAIGVWGGGGERDLVPPRPPRVQGRDEGDERRPGAAGERRPSGGRGLGSLQLG